MHKKNNYNGFDFALTCFMQGKFIVENHLDETCYILILTNPTIISKTGESELNSDYQIEKD